MAMRAKRVSVGTDPVRVLDFRERVSSGPSSLALKPSNGSVFVGPAGVTIDDGFPVSPGETFSVDASEDLYAVAAVETVEVRIFQAGVQ